MHPVKRNHHCLLVNAHKFAVRHGGCRLHAYKLSDQATLSEKISLAQYAQGCFLANLGYHSEPNPALLDVKDCVSRVSLPEDGPFLGNSHNLSILADRRKKFPQVESAIVLGQRGWCYHRNL